MNEIKLERELLSKSISLRELDKSRCSFEKQRQIEKEQNETYKKWKLMKGILRVRNNERNN